MIITKKEVCLQGGKAVLHLSQMPVHINQKRVVRIHRLAENNK